MDYLNWHPELNERDYEEFLLFIHLPLKYQRQGSIKRGVPSEWDNVTKSDENVKIMEIHG